MEGSKRSSALPTQTVIRDGNKAPNPMQAPAPQDLDPHLNPNYNFENFIKGNSNEFSRTVGETVAKIRQKHSTLCFCMDHPVWAKLT